MFGVPFPFFLFLLLTYEKLVKISYLLSDRSEILDLRITW